VVGQVAVSNQGLTGSLVQGSSNYLNELFPTGSFLAGTYVASQVGVLADVEIQTTVVDHAHGGLAASLDDGKVENSVRDVAIANGILLVCDEPDQAVNLYSLADGSYLGSSNALAEAPTHFAVNNGGLYVSAGSTLYWRQPPQSTSSASLALQTITPTPPSADEVKIGGISFDGASTVYVPYQNSCSICRASRERASPQSRDRDAKQRSIRLAYNASSTAFATSAVPLRPPNSIGLMPLA
jgi:hypothetical protein